jgi:RNA polymerase sigma-70 factor, ECF subfamily
LLRFFSEVSVPRSAFTQSATTKKFVPLPIRVRSYPHVTEARPELQDLTDAEIVARYLATRRDEDGIPLIQELFRRHYQKVVTWCVRLAGNRDDAYDLAQGIFVRVQRNLASFRGESKFSTWLYSITRSECMTFLKARPARGEAAGEGEADDLADVESLPPDQMLEREHSARMVRGLLDGELDDVEKQVFTLHYGDDVPLETITKLLALQNRSGAKAFIVSARRKLARAVARLRALELRLNT